MFVPTAKQTALVNDHVCSSIEWRKKGRFPHLADRVLVSVKLGDDDSGSRLSAAGRDAAGGAQLRVSVAVAAPRRHDRIWALRDAGARARIGCVCRPAAS